MSRKAAPSPCPRSLGALKAGGIVYRLGGTDKASVLKSLVEYMRVPEEVDREFLYRVLLAREALGSTGIGEGIAIPHVRNPIVLHVPQPMITLCFLEQSIDFEAFDGQPVDTLFSLISPTVRAHLHLLSRLSFALRDPAFKKPSGCNALETRSSAKWSESSGPSSPPSPLRPALRRRPSLCPCC